MTWKTSFAFSCLEDNFALGLKMLLIPFMRLITLPSRTNNHKTVPIDHWFHMDGLCMLSILISVWNVQTNLRYHKHWQGRYSSEIQGLHNLLPFASYISAPCKFENAFVHVSDVDVLNHKCNVWLRKNPRLAKYSPDTV
jgi:hypothetical protein